MTELRRATDADSDAMVALHRAAIRSAGADPDDVPGNDDLYDPEDAFIDAGGELLAVCRTDGPDRFDGLVAVGGYKPRDEATVELLRMAVAPDAQGEGHGSRLIETLESRALAAGYERVELETTARQERAMAFYPAHGYTETGRRQVDEYEVVRFEKSP